MEQLINTMLANAQMPQIPQVGKKGEASGQKDGFQKLLEQKQTDASQAPGQEKAETTQKPQDAQDAEKTPEADTEVPAAPKSEKELEDQMALAAMAMLQNPVVPVEQAMTPEAQAEAAADDIAPLMAETAPAPEVRSFVPEAEETEVPEVEGGAQTVDPALAEELPQTIQAPETAGKAEERTVEVKVETGHAEARAPEAADTEESGEPQGAEIETPVFEDVKAVPVKVGERYDAVDTQKPEMDNQLADAIRSAAQAGTERIQIRLAPQNLGSLVIEMTKDANGALQVVLHTSNARAAGVLNQHLDGLHTALQNYGQEEVHVEVQRGQESQEQHFKQADPDGRGQQQNRQQQERREETPENGQEFLQKLRLGLFGTDEL